MNVFMLHARQRPSTTSATRLTTGLMLCGVVLGAVFTAPPLAAQNGTTQTDLLKRQATERLRALHAEADALAGEERTLLGQLRKLEVARQIANEEARDAEAEAAEAARAVEAVDHQVRDLDAARNLERPRLAARFVEMYKLGRGRYMRMLLSASDMRQIGQAARTVSALADRDRARVRSYEATLKELDATRQALTQQQRQLNDRRDQAARAQAQAAKAIAAQSALVRDIDQRRDLNAQLVGELQAAQQKLDTTVAAVGAASAVPSALPIGPFRGALPWPVPGTARRSRAGGAQRPGLEIDADEGTTVNAIHGGQVAYAGSFEGLGNLVIVDHGNQTFSLYGHLLEFNVGRGNEVHDGQEIGRVGVSATGQPSLYFELRVNGRAVDPLTWLERHR